MVMFWISGSKKGRFPMDLARCTMIAAVVGIGCFGQDEVAAEGASPDAIKAELHAAIENSLRVFKHDFRVPVNSRQLNALLENEFGKVAPVRVYVADLDMVNKAGRATFEVELAGIPAEFRTEAERKANAMIRNSAVNRVWGRMTQSFLVSAEKKLAQNAQFEVEKDTEKALELTVKDLQQPFHKDITLDAVRLQIDRKNKLVRGARLYLSEGKGLIVRMNYKSAPVGDAGATVPAWSAIQIQQNAWLDRVLGVVGWPTKMVVSYGDYSAG